MPPASDSKHAQPNIQDVFLNYVRREKLTVTIRMMDGSELEGRIKNFDRFALILDHAGTDHDRVGVAHGANIARFATGRYCTATSQSWAPWIGVEVQVTW